MFDDSPENLSLEITDAIAFRKKHLTGALRIISRAMGPWYREDYADTRSADNRLFGYFAFIMPDLCFAKPAVRMDTDRPVAYGPLAKYIESAMNSWVTRGDFTSEHTQIVMDMLIMFGVSMVGLEPYIQDDLEHFEGGALRPYMCRVPPSRFVMDGRCEHWTQARFLGHEYFRDRDWLEENKEEKGFDGDALDKVSENGDDYGTNAGDGYNERLRSAITPDRHQVRLCDLWLRDTGEIHTLLMGRGAAQPVRLRKRPFYGPATGPYRVWGAYIVDGDPYPISRAIAALEGLEELNNHTRATSEAAKTYKRMIIVGGAQKGLKDAIINSDNGAVTMVAQFNPNLAHEYQIGGANQEQMGYLEVVSGRADRDLGMGDAQRGKASGKTATGDQIAQSNIDGATAWIKKCVYLNTADSLQDVAWYMIREPNIVLNVELEDPISHNIQEMLYVGGIQPGQEGIDWSGFTISIVDESMSLTDNQVIQARALQLAQIGPQLLQMKLQMPALNVDYIADMLGESMNIKNFSKLLFNQPVLRAMQQQMQNTPPGQQPGPPGQMQIPGGVGPQNAGLGQNLAQQQNAALGAPSPNNAVFPTTAAGHARPVSPKSNGPGMSPLPQFGLPKTAAIGR